MKSGKLGKIRPQWKTPPEPRLQMQHERGNALAKPRLPHPSKERPGSGGREPETAKHSKFVKQQNKLSERGARVLNDSADRRYRQVNLGGHVFLVHLFIESLSREFA